MKATRINNRRSTLAIVSLSISLLIVALVTNRQPAVAESAADNLSMSLDKGSQQSQPEANVGSGFTYQGQLKDGGNPANGQYDFQFKLYDASSTGTQVGSTLTVLNQTVSTGLFTTQLDFGTTAYQGQARWLEIAVRVSGGPTYTTLSPRQTLSAAPYAASLMPGTVVTGTTSQVLSALNTGSGLGMYGQSAANWGIKGSGTSGVWGEASASNGTGVAGTTSAGNGMAGSTGGGATVAGVYGTSTGSSGVGVRGTANNGTNALGVWGESTNGYGVYGTTTGSGSTGVRGTSTGPNGNGLRGTANNGTNAFGVWGDSTNGFGVFGQSATNWAIKGSGVSGVWGDSTGGGYGVSGSTTGGVSVAGVYGSSTGSDGVGVTGLANNGALARGVWGSSSSGRGVYGSSDSAVGVYGFSNSGTGVYGVGGTWAGFFIGDVYVTGSCCAAGMGTYKIDHPADPENKYLFHAAVQSAEMKNVYDGNVTTDAKGEAVVTLPDWFEALNKDFRYQLTILGEQFSQARVSSEIKDNRFTIKTDKPNIKVSWQVTGIRKDPYAQAHPIQVEVEKSADDQGKYLHPIEYGQLESKGINYSERQEMQPVELEKK